MTIDVPIRTDIDLVVPEAPARPLPARPLPARPVAEPVVAASTRDPGLGRAFALGSAIGFVVVFLVYSGVAWVAGVTAVPAIAVGLFTAFWGGPGFGGMLGAVMFDERRKKREAEATAR